MLSYLGVGSAAAFALGLGFWLWHKGKALKLTIFLFLIVGVTVGGLAGSLVGRLVTRALSLIGSLGGRLFGFGGALLVSALALYLLLEVFTAMSPISKFSTAPKRWHPWLALVLPLIVAAAGLPIANQLLGYVASLGV